MEMIDVNKFWRVWRRVHGAQQTPEVPNWGPPQHTESRRRQPVRYPVCPRCGRRHRPGR